MIFNPLKMIRDNHCPFLKKEIFYQDHGQFLRASLGNQVKSLVDYIDKQNAFNIDSMFDSLLRNCHMCDLVDNLSLFRVLKDKEFPSDTQVREIQASLRCAVAMHLYYMDILPQSIEIIKNIPNFTDIYITTTTEENKKIILDNLQFIQNKLSVQVVPNRGRVAAAYLLGLKELWAKYDILCLYHDKKSSHTHRLSGEGFAERLTENTLPSQAFVFNVLDQFIKEPRLGLLCPATPNHADFYDILGREWVTNYDNTLSLAKKLSLHVPMSPDKYPIAPLGDIFWFRTKALQKLLYYPWKLEDFPKEPCGTDGTILHAIERIHSYVAQDAGYYSAYVFSYDFASLEFSNLYYYLRHINKICFDHGFKGTFEEMMFEIRKLLFSQSKSPNLAVSDGSITMWTGQVRIILKHHIPRPLYKTLLWLKRLFFGPHNIGLYDGEPNTLTSSTQTNLTLCRLFLERHLPRPLFKIILRFKQNLWRFMEKRREQMHRFQAPQLDTDSTPLQGSLKNAYDYKTTKALPIQKVSVIIPNYNYKRFLKERINSVLAQTYPIHELIILDDASTDESVSFIEETVKEIYQIPVKLLLNEHNSGNVFIQWQKGIEEASGDFFWIAEADDSCEPQFLETAMQGFEDSSVLLSYTESTVIDTQGEILHKHSGEIFNIWNSDHWTKAYINDGRDEIAKYLCINNTILNASAVVWRKGNYGEILKEAQKFRLAGDWYVYCSILMNGRIAFHPQPLNLYRTHPGVVRKNTAADIEYKEIIYIQVEFARKLGVDIKTYKMQRQRRSYMDSNVSPSVKNKKVAWLTSLPSAKGSGGHRTIVQNINVLIRNGYDCDLYFDYGVSPSTHSDSWAAKTIDENCEACGANVYVGKKLRESYDLVIATIWNSAADVAEMICPQKAYFIQDYEPWFFSMGTEYLEAEQSYKFGLHPITIGRWLADLMEKKYGMQADHFDFCADLSIYHPDPTVKQERAICAIYQPEKPRRCEMLLLKALMRLNELAPDVTIYLYGSGMVGHEGLLPKAINLHTQPVQELNKLYNKCLVGLSMSSSNPSRIPFEMMASGLPVIDLKLENNQYDLPTDIALLAEPSPEAIAQTLLKVIRDDALREKMSKSGAQYMKDYPLEKGFQQFVQVIHNLTL